MFVWCVMCVVEKIGIEDCLGDEMLMLMRGWEKNLEGDSSFLLYQESHVQVAGNIFFFRAKSKLKWVMQPSALVITMT